LKAEFDDCRFKNCKIVDCELSTLKPSVVLDSKFCKSNECIDIKEDLHFEQILKFINSISPEE